MSDTATEETTTEETPREPCACECGGTPLRKRSRFLPGHDAQLKAQLYRTIRDEATSDEDRATAVARLEEYNWPQPAPKKVRKAKVKVETNGDSEAAG